VPGDPWHPLFVAELNDFAKAVVDDRDPPITASDALRVWQVLDAVVESGELGSPVKLSG
jgi:predicted dehydrogenase